MFSLIFAFLSVFATKRKHNGLTISEYAKKSVRVSVLEEKLDLWSKLQFDAQDAKNLKAQFRVFVNFCFFSVFATTRKHNGLTISEYAN